LFPAVHLANLDVMLWAVSRAPLAKLQVYKRRMQWTFPWASSFQSDFNYDYGGEFTEEQQRSGVVEHNYRAMNTRSELRDEDIRAVYGTDRATMTRDARGMSAFALRGRHPGSKRAEPYTMRGLSEVGWS
jgi:predicted dithiol-disulfide oxidoreductase (DUF899 family)